MCTSDEVKANCITTNWRRLIVNCCKVMRFQRCSELFCLHIICYDFLKLLSHESITFTLFKIWCQFCFTVAAHAVGMHCVMLLSSEVLKHIFIEHLPMKISFFLIFKADEVHFPSHSGASKIWRLAQLVGATCVLHLAPAWGWHFSPVCSAQGRWARARNSSGWWICNPVLDFLPSPFMMCIRSTENEWSYCLCAIARTVWEVQKGEISC